MTKDDIIRTAREAGFYDGKEDLFWISSEGLEIFAHLVEGIMWAEIAKHVALEREACAAICDELESFWSAEKDVALLNGDVALSNATSGEPRAARAIATAIRARGAALEKRS